MPTSIRPDAVIVRDKLDAATVERMNDVLDAEGLGRPLGEPVAGAADRTVVPVSGADPLRVRDTLAATGGVPDVAVDPQFDVATFDQVTFTLAGKAVGHGLTWDLDPLGGDPGTHLPEWAAPCDGADRPVVAVLDSGVRRHAALPATTGTDPFVLAPWRSPLPGSLGDDAGTPDDRLLTGHATFLAGLIRQYAPDARVLSLRVMRDDGKVDNSAVLDALSWLHDQVRDGRRVDVVCMAFGRHLDAGDDPAELDELHAALRRLGDLGVRMVASAGNYRDDRPVYPAAFAGEGFWLVSVGSGRSAQDRDEFSSFGAWVTTWRDGERAHSIMPPDRWARWDGTSFATAVHAAELVNPAA